MATKKTKIKNLVAPKGGGLAKELRKFNLTAGILRRALSGNKRALKLIGDLGNEGRRIKELAPQIKEQALNAIDGSEALNTLYADVLKAAGKSGLSIDKAINSTELSNAHLLNQQQELELDFTAAKEREQLRHKQATNYIELKAWLDKHFLSIDGDYKLLQAELLPEIKQQTVDLQHDRDLGKYYLEMGSDARDKFKPKKEYAKPSIIERIKETILGF